MFVFADILAETHLPFLGGNSRRNHSWPANHHSYLEHDRDYDVDYNDGDDDDNGDDDDDGDDVHGKLIIMINNSML